VATSESFNQDANIFDDFLDDLPTATEMPSAAALQCERPRQALAALNCARALAAIVGAEAGPREGIAQQKTPL